MKAHENRIIIITMVSMFLTILGLSVFIYKIYKSPVIVQKTEIIKVDHQYAKIPKSMTTGTYRVKCAYQHPIQKMAMLGMSLNETKESTGSAVGVDLTEYGLTEPRFLLTAAHVVCTHPVTREEAAGFIEKIVDVVEIQIRTDKVKKWVHCKILIVDKDRDLCLLEALEDLPKIFKLADDEDVGAAVVVAGCPIGTTPSASLGYLTSKDPEITGLTKCQLWQASGPFYYGNSGGPVFDAEAEKIVGILIAGLGKEGGDGTFMIPLLAICVPCVEIRAMLDHDLKLSDEGSPIDEFFVAPKISK